MLRVAVICIASALVGIFAWLGAIPYPAYLALLLLALVASFVWVAWYERREFRRRAARQAQLTASSSALPIDDGPLEHDGHTAPTLGELFGHAHRSELLAPVRDRLRSTPPFEPGVQR